MDETIVSAFCKGCKRSTKHEVLCEIKEANETPEFQQQETWQIIKCRGCDKISFRSVYENLQEIDELGFHIETIVLYPYREALREPNENLRHVPLAVHRIYEETINALNASMRLLAAIGLRTMIEAICIDQQTPEGNLEKRISALAKQGVLSVAQAEILHSHRFLGNIAAHEIEAPETDELVLALQIAETVMETIYVIPEMNERLKENQAKRKAKDQSSRSQILPLKPDI
jgi:uncharacterized protein DUF4145